MPNVQSTLLVISSCQCGDSRTISSFTRFISRQWKNLTIGSGATVFYNLLKGQLVAPQNDVNKFHIHEKNHSFVKKGEKYYRFNELWRDTLSKGEVIDSKKIYTNFAPIMYHVDGDYINERNINLISLL